jgi:hypothetical protein
MPTSIQSLTEREQKRLWVSNHRGKLAEIARDLDVTHTAVSAVLYFNLPSSAKKNFRIERALAAAGAPFMKERLAERLEQQERCA